MKPNHLHHLPLVVATATFAWAAVPMTGQLAYESDTVNQSIPDDDPLGLTRSLTVSTTDTKVVSVQVSLEIEGGYNGDYYAYLYHGGTSVVLLNRVGRASPDRPDGYLDSGMAIWLADGSPDVHTYRLNVTGNQDVPIGNILGGTWSPDGRTTSPTNVEEGDLRLTQLSAFKDMNPNGAWSLFIADRSGVNEGILKTWSVYVTTVPEPGEMALLAGLGLAAFGIWRRMATPKQR